MSLPATAAQAEMGHFSPHPTATAAPQKLDRQRRGDSFLGEPARPIRLPEVMARVMRDIRSRCGGAAQTH